MKANVKQAHDAWRESEQKLYELQDEYNAKRQALEDKYRPRLDKAGQETADLQKTYCDLDAAQALADRDIDEHSKRELADSLGLTLPD